MVQKDNEIYDKPITLITPTRYDNDQRDWRMCPKSSCFGNIIEVDELILPIIINLNKKGYKTRNCCIGHYYDIIPNSYIQFEDEIKLPNVPKNYHVEELNDKNTILRNDFGLITKDGLYLINHGGISESKLINMILDNAKSLLKWSESLSNIKDNKLEGDFRYE